MLDLLLPAAQLAPMLLGAVVSDGEISVQLTEVEAYAGADDPAAHAWGGPRPRTEALFAAPGTLYCYLSHGLHICGNLTCVGDGSAVLFRAGRVLAGTHAVRERRGAVAEAALARGPGNLGRAFGWTLADSGRRYGEELRIELPSEALTVCCGPRVGVSHASERPWRFWVPGDASVSAYRRSPRAGGQW